MNKWQRIAMLLICLVISIPIVFAQELSIQKFSGKDNAQGYARPQDQLTIEALTKIPGEDIIDPEQVRLYFEDGYILFDSCNASGTYHTCRIFEPTFSAYEPIDFKIELKNDGDNTVAQEDMRLVIDNQAPVIKEMKVDPPMSNGKVSVTYIAEDYAMTYGDTTECSGLKAIKITTGTTIHTTDSAGLGECNKENTVEIDYDTGGKKQICVTALDHVNYASPPKCAEVSIDKSPPNIEELTILDPAGFEITHVRSGEERIANINARITDDVEVDSENVLADLKQLNPTITDLLTPDLTAENIYSWRGIPVTEASNCKIIITAKDTLGNEARKDFPCSIKADDTPPTVKGLISDAEKDGKPLYGYGTAIIIAFEDKDNTGGAGIGLQNRNAYLDLNAIGMETMQADACIQLQGADWICSWIINPPATTPEGPYTIKLMPETADDLGNTIGTDQVYDIVYDNTGPRKPEILEAGIVSGEAGTTYEGGAVRGDYVRFKVRSGDFTTAYANFTDIGRAERTLFTECVDAEGGAVDCTFEEQIGLDGPYTATIGFTFYDDALNKASTTTTLEIYGIDNATTAQYWKKPSVTCTPAAIDRQTASLMPTIATCRIDLYTPRKDITTLSIAGPTSPEQCTGDIDLNVNDLYLINTAEGSESPYLFIKLEAKNYYKNTLKINCPLNIYSKREQTVAGEKRYYVSPNPQKVDANITLQFYNNPMELANVNFDEKINKSLEDSFANAKWIGDLRKWLYYGELMCWIKTLISNVIGALYMVAVVLGMISPALKNSVFPPTAAAGATAEASKITICNTEEQVSKIYGDEINGIIKFLDAVCSVINCAAVGKGGIEGFFGGGGMPWCNKFDALLKEIPGLGRASEEAGISLMPNIKDSLILSIICFCLPGIVYNLEKLRQINCFKAVCLHDYVKEQGYTTEFCDEMHGYLTCMFVYGELFSLLPFAAFFDKLVDMAVTFISDPIALFTVALGAVCETTCPEEGSVTYALCALYKTTAVIMESIAAVKQATDKKNEFGKPPNTQYCDRMEKIKEEMKK